jgi:cytochrome c oxidase subunit 1
MIGALDMALPRMNNMSFWILPFAFALLLSTIFMQGGGPAGGWTMYPPLVLQTGDAFPFLIFAVHFLGVSSIMGAINIIATVFNMRAPGMSLMQMPLFVWTWVITSFLLIASLPVLAGAVTMLLTDKYFGTSFFSAAGGGDPVLFQHIFWFFGHPEVYILALPAFGIVSSIIPTFSRKPLFGYASMVYATASIAILSFFVWAHHMFTVGLPIKGELFFMYATMLIAVPTGVKVFNWMATMWKGSMTFETPMLFAVAFVILFTIGGFSGLMLGITPVDFQYHDTYFVVAHFHYVLLTGAVFALMAAVYYWLPKWTGHMYDERLGKIHFWLMIIGFNLTFGPMHWLGLQGQVRRTWVYAEETNLGFWNLIVSIGAFIIALSILVFMANWIYSRRKGPDAGFDPWDARTIEWSIPSPTPVWNFSKAPEVKSLDDFWHMKYDEDEDGRPVRKDSADALMLELEEEGLNPKEDIVLPNPSYFPIILASGLPFLGYAVIYKMLPLAIVGTLLILIGSFGWGTEPLEEEFIGDGENE